MKRSFFLLLAVLLLAPAMALGAGKKLKDKDLSKALAKAENSASHQALIEDGSYMGWSKVSVTRGDSGMLSIRLEGMYVSEEMEMQGVDTIRINKEGRVYQLDSVYTAGDAGLTATVDISAKGQVTWKAGGEEEQHEAGKRAVFDTSSLYLAAALVTASDGAVWEGLVVEQGDGSMDTLRLSWGIVESMDLIGGGQVDAQRIDVERNGRPEGVLFVAGGLPVAYDARREDDLGFQQIDEQSLGELHQKHKKNIGIKRELRATLLRVMKAFERGDEAALKAEVDVIELGKRLVTAEDLLVEGEGLWIRKIQPQLKPATDSEALWAVIDTQLNELAHSAAVEYQRGGAAIFADVNGYEARFQWNGERWLLTWWEGFKAEARFLGK